MARKRSFSSQLYRAARTVNTVEAVGSGNPRRIAKRGVNVAKGRALARTGFFRWLWR